MREEEAKKKWCPFGRRFFHERMTTGKVAVINRTDEDESATSCLADKCMLWVPNEAEGAYRDEGTCGLMNTLQEKS